MNIKSAQAAMLDMVFLIPAAMPRVHDPQSCAVLHAAASSLRELTISSPRGEGLDFLSYRVIDFGA